MKICTGVLLAGASALVIGLPMRVAAQHGRAKAGILTCDKPASAGVTAAAKNQLTCVFVPVHGAREVYVGSVAKVGRDPDVSTASRMVWNVYAPALEHVGALAGQYAGLHASGAGLGPDVLVGGSNRTALQPMPSKGQTGVNPAAGVAGLTLEPAR